MTDLETWFHDEAKDKIYRLLVYKKVWTPYEMENTFSDESEFEGGNEYSLVKILDMIELPDKDVLIKFQQYYVNYIDNDEESEIIVKLSKLAMPFFEKLSNIKLSEASEDDYEGLEIED